jgi:hypothetical protein
MNNTVRAVVDRVNTCAVSWQNSPRFGRLVRQRLTVVRYTGRRSGREFSIPVGYARTDGGVRIDVMMPDAKNWWRNFTGDGGPITVQLDGVDRSGHATARRLSARRAVVDVRFAEAKDRRD